MLFSLLVLLAAQDAAVPDNVVAVSALGEGRYQLALTTTESAKGAAAKMKAAMQDVCRETGIASQSGIFLAMISEKPLRARISQTVTCKPVAGEP